MYVELWFGIYEYLTIHCSLPTSRIPVLNEVRGSIETLPFLQPLGILWEPPLCYIIIIFIYTSTLFFFYTVIIIYISSLPVQKDISFFIMRNLDVGSLVFLQNVKYIFLSKYVWNVFMLIDLNFMYLYVGINVTFIKSNHTFIIC